MGNCRSVNQSKNKFQETNNVQLFIDNLYKGNVENMKLLLDNTDTNFYKYDHLTIYHHLVIYAIQLSPESLKNMCDLFDKYSIRFGPMDRQVKYYKYVQYLPNEKSDSLPNGSIKYTINFLTSNTYRIHHIYKRTFNHNPQTHGYFTYHKYTNIYQLNNLNPLQLCLHLNTNFHKHTNYNILIDLFNKIK